MSTRDCVAFAPAPRSGESERRRPSLRSFGSTVPARFPVPVRVWSLTWQFVVTSVALACFTTMGKSDERRIAHTTVFVIVVVPLPM